MLRPPGANQRAQGSSNVLLPAGTSPVMRRAPASKSGGGASPRSNSAPRSGAAAKRPPSKPRAASPRGKAVDKSSPAPSPALKSAAAKRSPSPRASQASQSAQEPQEKAKPRVRVDSNHSVREVPMEATESFNDTRSHRSDTMATVTSQNSDSSSIKVCIRVRPLSEAEKASGLTDVCNTEADTGSSIQMMTPENMQYGDAGGEKDPTFTFDWVISGNASQQTVYELLGQRIVQAVADGFHGCVFAHGQTGSGKSHTIFGEGNGELRGLLPRISDSLFEELKGGIAQYIVKLSYLEIYNENLKDLLKPVGDNVKTDDEEENKKLQIRNHPKFGVFVEGLTSEPVSTEQQIHKLLDYGHKIRVVGRTNMNAASSRSHAVVTLHVDLTSNDTAGIMRRRSQLHIVDLAGSERMKQVGTQERRKTAMAKETKNINKSLAALSLVISELSAKGSKSAGFVPVRNSKLTHILAESLMGNCKTLMLACISPASSSFGVSLSTLRFAAAAKKIRTKPVKNEELEANLVQSLRAEIDQLKQQLSDAITVDQKKDLMTKLRTTQVLTEDMLLSWNEKNAQATAEAKHRDGERKKTLIGLGLASGAGLAQLIGNGLRGSASSGSASTVVKHEFEPYLVNVCDDPLLSGCLTYLLPKGEVVHVGSQSSCKIHIDGLGVQAEMCRLLSRDGRTVEVKVGEKGRQSSKERNSSSQRQSSKERISSSHAAQRGSLFKSGAPQVFVNNELVKQSAQLHHGQRLRIGHAHIFQLIIPQAVEENDNGMALESVGQSAVEQSHFQGYATHLRERLGSIRANHVFHRLHELQKLIDEANDITEELRGDDANELVFKAHLLTDPTDADQEPDLAVVLRISEKAIEVSESGKPIFSAGRELDKTDVWSEPKFLLRLEAMRDLHHEIGNRKSPWGQSTDSDPWTDDIGIPTAGGLARDASLEKVANGSEGNRVSTTSEGHARRSGGGNGDITLGDPRLQGLDEHQQLTDQHQRALDFIAKREVEYQGVFKDMEEQLEESQKRVQLCEAARDEALNRLPSMQEEFKKVCDERDVLMRDALAQNEMFKVVTDPTEATAAWPRPQFNQPVELAYDAPAPGLAPTLATTGSAQTLQTGSTISLPGLQMVGTNQGSHQVLPPGPARRSMSPRRSLSPARRSGVFPVGSTTLVQTTMPAGHVVPSFTTGHTTTVMPAPFVSDLYGTRSRAISPGRIVTPGPVRPLTPGRNTWAGHETMATVYSSNGLPANVQSGYVGPSFQSSAVRTPQTAESTVLRQRLQGELTDIRQELQSLTDLCQNLDTEIPGDPRSRNRGYSQFSSAVTNVSGNH